MKIINQIRNDLRVVESKWYFPAIFGPVYKLQIKSKYFWKSISWIYKKQYKNKKYPDFSGIETLIEDITNFLFLGGKSSQGI